MRKFKKIGITMLVLVVALTMMLSGCSSSNNQATQKSASNQGTTQSTANKIKVAFVYVGSVGDYGYNYAQDQGRKYLIAHMPNVQTTYVENVPETADCERVFTDLAQKGYNIIFGTSYGYMNYMVSVSKKFPNVVFEHCSGYKTTANLGTYFARQYQIRYLTGMVAGKYTKSNVLGFIAPFGTPEVVRNVDAFALGAQSVNPKVKVKVVWTNSWSDPPQEKTAAYSLIDAGADVLAMHVDSPAFAQAAQSRGDYAVGHDSDMMKFAPKAILTGDVVDWGPFFVQTVKEVENHTWKPTQFWGGIKDGTVSLAPFNDAVVSKSFQAQVLAKEKEIENGTFNPFQGPIYDQNGNLKVKQGESASDQTLLSINWFVKGVEGTIPKS